jgi:predicted RNA-binding protein YlqC (UPF0109 family)
MQAFLEFVARNLVDHPEEVVVGVRPGPGKTAYELRVHRSDVGKLVGKNGQTIEAIRALVSAASAKKGQRVQVEIMEESANATPPAGAAAYPVESLPDSQTAVPDGELEA